MMNKKSLKSLRNDKRAVSPVIGVILMVAITVILAAVIAAFVFGINPTGQKTPNLQLRASVDATNLKLQHMGGDPIEFGDCIIKAKGDDAPTTNFAAVNLTVGQFATQAHGVSDIGPGAAVTIEIIHTPSQSYVLDTVITAVTDVGATT